MRFLVFLALFAISIFGAVDINKASAQELMEVKGIGASKAQAIVEYREKNGCFSDLDALVNVKGFGKKIIEKNKENLIASACK